MKDYRDLSFRQAPEFPKLKVVHKKSGHLQVFFPFTEVPVEMTKQYFDKHVSPDEFVIDFDDEFDQSKAG